MAHDRHAVLRERPRLVRANDLRAAKRLHGVHLADDRMALAHLGDTDGQGDRHDRDHALRNRGYGQRNGHHEGVEYFVYVGEEGQPPMAHSACNEDDGADGDHALRQDGRQLIELNLKRC